MLVFGAVLRRALSSINRGAGERLQALKPAKDPACGGPAEIVANT
jgi:hypothetical protein